MPKHIVSEQEFSANITAIRVTKNEAELAAILHASPEWGYMSEAMIKLFYQEIDQQRIFLDEIRRIANMTVAERAKLIPYYSRYPEKAALVSFAKINQAQVLSMVHNFKLPQDLEALNNKALEVAIYLRQHNRDTNAEYSTQIECLERLNNQIANLEYVFIQQIINNNDRSVDEKIALLTQRVADLRLKKIKAKSIVGEFNDYIIMLRVCAGNAAHALVELRAEAGQTSAGLLPSFKTACFESNPVSKNNVEYARKLIY